MPAIRILRLISVVLNSEPAGNILVTDKAAYGKTAPAHASHHAASHSVALSMLSVAHGNGARVERRAGYQGTVAAKIGSELTAPSLHVDGI